MKVHTKLKIAAAVICGFSVLGGITSGISAFGSNYVKSKNIANTASLQAHKFDVMLDEVLEASRALKYYPIDTTTLYFSKCGELTGFGMSKPKFPDAMEARKILDRVRGGLHYYDSNQRKVISRLNLLNNLLPYESSIQEYNGKSVVGDSAFALERDMLSSEVFSTLYNLREESLSAAAAESKKQKMAETVFLSLLFAAFVSFLAFVNLTGFADKINKISQADEQAK